ncbi:MAG: hypothetical protein ACOYL6_16560 [Bacteriovoracaceae bacterium]
MNYFILLMLLFNFSHSFAQDQVSSCYYKISLNHSMNSRVFHLTSSEVQEYEVLNEEMAISTIDLLLKKEINCSVETLLYANPITCYKLKTGITCEVLTSIGYFIIHRSAYGSFDHNVIWTRWD